MIVVAPDHPSRDLLHVLSGEADHDQQASVDELLGSLDLIVAEGETAGSPFEGHWSTPTGWPRWGTRRAAARSSAPPRTSASTATCRWRPAAPTGTTDYPDRPSLLPRWRARRHRPRRRGDPASLRSGTGSLAPLGARRGGPQRLRRLLHVRGQRRDHRGRPRPQGSGKVLDGQPGLRSAGASGCIAPAAPIEEAFPIVRHGVTSWLRSLFHEDGAPVGLEAETPGAFELGITVESK